MSVISAATSTVNKFRIDDTVCQRLISLIELFEDACVSLLGLIELFKGKCVRLVH